MPAPHPLAAVAQQLVRDQRPRERRAIRARRRWWRHFFAAKRTPVVTTGVPTAVRDSAPVAAEAPPGLALPPTLVLPQQREATDEVAVVRPARSA